MSAKVTTDQDDLAINGDLTRCRALLKISGTVEAQPTVDSVLHSLATLLSNVVSFDNIALLLFDPSGQRLALRALEALKAAHGQVSGHGGAAERLGLKRTTLQYKMRRLGICKGDYQTYR